VCRKPASRSGAPKSYNVLQQKLKLEQEKVKAEQEKVKAEQEKVKAEQEKFREEQAKFRAEREKVRLLQWQLDQEREHQRQLIDAAVEERLKLQTLPWGGR
jgi:hypothetical protein